MPCKSHFGISLKKVFTDFRTSRITLLVIEGLKEQRERERVRERGREREREREGVLYSAVTHPFWDIYVHKIPPSPLQNTPFPGLNLKVGKMRCRSTVWAI